MEITISNKIRIKDPHPVIKEILLDQLTHKNPKHVDADKMGFDTRRIEEYLYNFEFDGDSDMLIPRGMRGPLLEHLNALNIPAQINDERSMNFIGYLDGSKINYRQYQQPAIETLLHEGPEGILVAPPGSGKTVMGLSLIPVLLQNTLWLTHTDRLFKQTYERCLEFIPGLKEDDIGMIGGGKWKVGKVLTIAMIPTLVRNIEKLSELRNEWGLVLLDEAHHCPASTFLSVISQLNPYFLYGLTATAYRRDKLESMMFQCLGPIRAKITKDTVAAHKGIIAPKVIYTAVKHLHKVDDNNIPNIFKNHIIYNTKRNAQIVRDVVREAKLGNFCIVSSGRKVHCDLLHEMIKKEWGRTGVATGKYSKKVIDGQIEAFNKNEITVLITTPELLGEGFDVDFLNRLFITTSFRTEARAEQLVGRIQRFHKDKADAIVYDYVDEGIGVLVNQFYSKYGECRSKVYKRLGLEMLPYDQHVL